MKNRAGKKTKKLDTNIVVIGGSACLVTAYIAAAVKEKVTLVEKHKMGGVKIMSVQKYQLMKLTIGQLAKNAQVTIETIRYYQRKSLLTEPDKPTTGYRQYPIEAIAKIKFIKSAQQAGFTLKEISELLSLDRHNCDEIRKLAEQKCQQINEQLENLQLLRNGLDNLIKGCLNTRSTGHCSLSDAFYEPSK